VRIVLRTFRPDDGPSLQRIERLAGDRFGEVGLHNVADDEPLSVDTLSEYAIRGGGWGRGRRGCRRVGYVIVDDVDGQAHIEQITVEPDHQAPAWAAL
jgi:ribosomal protein S18 acetylase RimI-like enzyme